MVFDLTQSLHQPIEGTLIHSSDGTVKPACLANQRAIASDFLLIITDPYPRAHGVSRHRCIRYSHKHIERKICLSHGKKTR